MFFPLPEDLRCGRYPRSCDRSRRKFRTLTSSPRTATIPNPGIVTLGFSLQVVAMKKLLQELNFKDGLIPAVIVNAEDNQVLTLCYLNEKALAKTLETGIVHLFRRSKGRLMKKGETSGHTQHLQELRVDCAGNSLVLKVEQRVAACHKGYMSCYYRRYDEETDSLVVDGDQIFEPDEVY